MTVIDIVSFGDLVQTIDAWITSFQSLGQFGHLVSVSQPIWSQAHVLVPRPVKFNPRLAQPFLNVDTTPALLNRSSGLDACTTWGFASLSHNRVVDFFSISFLWPSLPNHSFCFKLSASFLRLPLPLRFVFTQTNVSLS